MQKFTYNMFDEIEKPIVILSSVYHKHYGTLTNIDLDSFECNFNMNSAQEISFDVYKYVDERKCELWDKLISLRYVYIPSHHEYYKIDVTIDEDDKTVKHITGTSAGEWELSNRKIQSLEINTALDITEEEEWNPDTQKYDKKKLTLENSGYTILYNPDDATKSLLNRALKDRAPDWKVKYVAPTIANKQREFSVSNQSIYDFFTNTIAKELDCLFKFNSVKREISVYDLLNTCTNLVDGKPCGERGEFTDVCPKCGNTDKTKFIRGYGTDTHIFISAENYASKITVDGDEASVKNCFKVTGGDDFMTDTIKNCNPAGSEYIYRFSQADYDDMPEQLVEKLQTYFETYNEAEASYQELVRQYYNAETAYSFYKTSMMPRSNSKHWESEHGYNYGDVCYVLTLPSWCYLECSVPGTSGLIEFDATDFQDGDIIQDGTVTWIVRKHIITVPSATQTLNDVIIPYLANNYIYLEDSTTKNAITMKNWVLRLLEAEVNPLFRLEIPTDTTLDWDESGAIKTLTFNITVTNTTDPDDIASTSTDVSPQPLVARCKVSSSREEYIEYMTQLVEKRLTRSDTTFTELWKIDNNNDFKELLTEYSLDMLSNFQQSYAGCIDVLISQGVKDESNDFHGVNLYTEIYDPYNTRIGYIEDEMVRRKVTVDTWDGIRTSLSNQMTEVHNQLDLKTFLKDPTAEDPDWLWHIFFNYLRESDYQNSTYISTGLSDNFLVKDAATVLDKARLELEKASELQYSLSDDLNNLLNTSEFADYKDKFELGDYIVCRVDEENYKLRLINLSYQYSNPESVSVTFANVTKIKNYFSDVQTVLNQATAMSSSYDITLHQVDKNNTTTAQVTTWNAEGLNSALTRIKNNNMEEVTYDTNGITLKEYDVTYDPLNTDENNYSNKQLRLTHDMIAFTKDNWVHASLALGENQYEYYDSNHVRKTDTDYGLIAKFVDAGYIHGSQIISGEIYSEGYTSATGTFIDLKNNTITFGGDKLTFDPTNGLSIKGAIYSTSGDIAGFTIESNNIHKGVTSINDSDTTHVGVYVGTDGIRNQNGATHVTISGGDIKGKQNWGEYSID